MSAATRVTGSAPLDVRLELLDEELLLVEHELDDVAHGDHADRLATLLDEQMAGGVVAHDRGALRLGRVHLDSRDAGAHRLADGTVRVAGAGEHGDDEVAL